MENLTNTAAPNGGGATGLLFTPEAGMPWLRNDAAMQTPEAFRGMKEITIGEYDFMAPHFPTGTTFLLKSITSHKDLMPGAVYWHEVTGAAAAQWGEKIKYRFGRYSHYERLHEWRKHSFCEMVMRDDNQSIYAPRRQDGTIDWCIYFRTHEYKIWQVTHYINPPAAQLQGFIERYPDLLSETGLTLDQARWLAENERIQSFDAEEFRARIVGQAPDLNLRAVLANTREEHGLLHTLLGSIKPLPNFVKKRKAGIVALTTYHHSSAKYDYTRYYRQEEVQAALDWFTGINRLRQAKEAVKAQIARAQAANNLNGGEGRTV